jgi:basic membrane protein A
MVKALKRYDGACIEDEAVDGESDTVREERVRRMADVSDIVIAVGSAYDEAVNEAAPEYPKVHFAVIDGQDTDDEANPNVAYLRFAEDEGSFLVGAAAALKSKTDTVGFLGGVRDERTSRYEAGYRAGAVAITPDVKVLVTYLKESVDQEKTPDDVSPTDAAADLFDQGADVVYQVDAGTGSGVFNAAVDAEAWAIGSDYDQYQTANEDQRTQVLTSMVKRADTVTYDFVRRVEKAQAPTGTLTYGIKAHGVDYATSGGYVQNLEGRLDGLADRIADGEITIAEPAQTPVG